LKELYQNSDLSEYEVNLASVACWLAYLSAEQEGFSLRADTLSTYRTEALYLLKALPNTRITDYEWEDVEDVLEFDLAENPPIRRKAVVKSIRNYLSAQVGLPLSELDLENSHFSSLSKTTREKILTPSEVWKLLEGLEPERSNKERNLLLAVILGYFGMLRAGEICRLRCGDLVLGSSQPYVRIYNTKCRKSRIMPLDDLPDVLVALLKRLRRDRQVAIEVAQGQRGWQRVIGESLLVGEAGQALSPRRLSALVKERLKECGFGETSLHDFRKGGANWRYYSEANVPAADIGKRLGHSGLMVTFKCYLKGLDLVQREMAQKLHLMPQSVGISSLIPDEIIPAPTEEWTLPVAKLALLADVSRQQAYNLLDGRKLTLQVVCQILQQEVMSSIVSSIT
jgi:integrase